MARILLLWAKCIIIEGRGNETFPRIRPSATAVFGILLLFGQGPAPACPSGGAEVWYLGHCGYAVRTSDHLLIFDYQERRDGQQPKSRPDRPSLAAGWIAPEEIKGLKVRVFVSHAHNDHYDPVILTWKEAVPDIAYYFGWKATDDPSHHVLAGPRAGLAADGLEIATINSTIPASPRWPGSSRSTASSSTTTATANPPTRPPNTII